ncbi:HD domain-containing protein [Ruminococcus sp.]|uniref:HD domain-containing protein n=1 Tax=Ruminococcus sp. TaxID=41978 RepID=UPI003F043B65
MNATDLINILHIAEKLKDTTRHSYTSGGRHESVADHTFRTALMAYFVKDEFPEADIDKVIKMCLIHDIGEAFTGDIPAFKKTTSDEESEKRQLFEWIGNLPAPYCDELATLFEEMIERKTIEAKLFKALDGLEAVIQHNEADLSTWSNNEYELNLTYAEDRVCFSPYLKDLRKIIKDESLKKIKISERRSNDE